MSGVSRFRCLRPSSYHPCVDTAGVEGATVQGTLDVSRKLVLVRVRRWTAATTVVLAAVFVLVRVPLALSPALSETYYDEALTGLMSLDILKGIPQVFYWGQPYLGAVDAYLAAAAFYVFGPSTLALRLGTAWVSLLWVWAAWRIGRRIAGEEWGIVAGLQLALPPIFLTYMQLSSHAEGVTLTLATVTLAAAVCLVDSPRPARDEVWVWVLLGLAAGLAWWASQMATILLGTAALGLLVARPVVLRGPGPYLALGMFGVGSLPFWWWNLRHEWTTFHHLLQWGGDLPGFAERVRLVASSLAQALRDTYWDGRAVPLSPWESLLGWIVIGAVYVPAVGLALWRLVLWVRRVFQRARPWQDALDLVALAFWLTVAGQLLTWFGTSGVIRYSLTFYGPLPLLVTAMLARVARMGRLGRGAAISLAAALLVFNLLTHVAFLSAGVTMPVRPVDAVIARLQALGTTTCYADSRISQVITFESTRRIQCAAYDGIRDYATLQLVDRIEAPETVAIVTHQKLQNPKPSQMARDLARVGGAAQQSVVGDYVVFHHFVPPDPNVRPVSTAGWRARASSGESSAAWAFDRQVWTRWSAPSRPDEWLEIDLGQARPITQVSLLAATQPADAPMGLRVETSLDGERWSTAAREPDIRPGLHWWKGHPRLDLSGRVIVRFAPRDSRYVRLTSLGQKWPARLWSVAELFVYETATSPWKPSPDAVEALAAATREMDHWMDDPTGPNPVRAPVTYEHRRGQVRWTKVFAATNDALARTSDWEEPHHLYGIALARANEGRGLEASLDRAAMDGAWLEVVRFAELLEAEPGTMWRAGRLAKWAEALERLGRSTEAAAIRARPEPAPARPVRVQFGRELELVGIDGPSEARPGETVQLGYHWRRGDPSAHEYWVFLHPVGMPGSYGRADQVVGGPDYGPSRWAPGERIRQTVTFTVPPDTAPGTYPLRVGVWLPYTGRQLSVLSSDLPQRPRDITIGTLTVIH
jgi:hypothetical protein